MGRLLYSAICSLDGYIRDRHGSFAWAMPSEEGIATVVDLDSTVGTHLYGRLTYELMVGWELDPSYADSPATTAFADAWVALDKVVFSTTLTEVTTSRTRLERRFDPAAVRALVEESERDVSVAGPTLAGAAFAAGLVDEVQLLVLPVVVGSGLPAIVTDTQVDLELVEERRLSDGAVVLRHRVLGAPRS